MPYATYGFNKTIAADTIRFIVTVAIVVYKGLIPVVGRILTHNINCLSSHPFQLDTAKILLHKGYDDEKIAEKDKN